MAKVFAQLVVFDVHKHKFRFLQEQDLKEGVHIPGLAESVDEARDILQAIDERMALLTNPKDVLFFDEAFPEDVNPYFRNWEALIAEAEGRRAAGAVRVVVITWTASLIGVDRAALAEQGIYVFSYWLAAMGVGSSEIPDGALTTADGHIVVTSDGLYVIPQPD